MDEDLSPIIKNRFSSRLYRPDKYLSIGQIKILLEAARWAPSSMNAQPWRYIIFDRRNSFSFSAALDCLDPGNRIWASQASVLFLSVAANNRPDGKPNHKALHDTGLANENLLLQATSMGLNCRPMGGFDSARAISSFHIPPDFTPVIMIAVGYPGILDQAIEDIRAKEKQPRERRPISDFAHLSDWDHPLNE